MLEEISPRVVRSSRPLTILAECSDALSSSTTFMMGVLTDLEALMISLSLGTPRVTFMLATPAKWKVLRVIWVPGSPMLCAATAPTAVPGSTSSLSYFE